MRKKNIFLLMRELKKPSVQIDIIDDTPDRHMIKKIYKKIHDKDLELEQIEFIENILLEKEKLISFIVTYM